MSQARWDATDSGSDATQTAAGVTLETAANQLNTWPARISELDDEDRTAILRILDGLITKNRIRTALRAVE